jgi:RHS repeat-associated protein
MDHSDATGLSYRRNRYYDPASGQFTQQDPIGIAGGLNLYGYANGDPINFSDPFGLMGCDPPDKPCTVSALFIGISATAHLGAQGMTGGASVGVTLNGLDSQVFIQVEGGLGVGPGLYVGGGGHAGLQGMSVDPEIDNITSSTAGYGFVTANAGAGPSGGGTVTVSQDRNPGVSIAPRAGFGGGAGVQAMVGVGASRTIAFPSLRSFLRGLLDDDEPGRR